MTRLRPLARGWAASMAASAVAIVLIDKLVIDSVAVMPWKDWFGLLPLLSAGAALAAIVPVSLAYVAIYLIPALTATQPRRIVAALVFALAAASASAAMHRPRNVGLFTGSNEGAVGSATEGTGQGQPVANLRIAPQPAWPAFGTAYLPMINVAASVFLTTLLAAPRRRVAA